MHGMFGVFSSRCSVLAVLACACATLLAPNLDAAEPAPVDVPQAASPTEPQAGATVGDHPHGDKPCGDCEHPGGTKPCCGASDTSPGDDDDNVDDLGGGDDDELGGGKADCPAAAGPHGGKHHALPPIMRHLLAAREFRPGVLLQLQPAFWTDKDNNLARGDRAERGGFTMRTARLGFSGQLGPRIRYVVDTDLVRLQTQPVTQAFVGLRAWHGAEFLAGAHKMPFSRSGMLGSGDLALVERPLSVQAMAPFYQLGTSLTGHYAKLAGLRWYLGAFNSFERNTNFYAGIRQNAGLNGNRFGGLSYVARVQLEPLGAVGRTVADHDHRNFRFEIGAGALHNDGGTTTVNAVSADLQLKWRGVHVLAEILMDSAEPKDRPQTAETIPEKLSRQAFVGEIGYALYHWNIAGRVELVDPNKTVKDGLDETILSAATGVQMMRNRVRLQLQFDHRVEAQSAVKNDVLFGQIQLRL